MDNSFSIYNTFYDGLNWTKTYNEKIKSQICYDFSGKKNRIIPEFLKFSFLRKYKSVKQPDIRQCFYCYIVS